MFMVANALQPVFEPAEVRALWKKYVDDPLPAEKAKAKAEGIKIAGELKAEGGHKFEGGGQKMCSIDLKTYIRVEQQCGVGCWHTQGFIDRFLRDNPQYCAPGYYPKPVMDLKHFK